MGMGIKYSISDPVTGSVDQKWLWDWINLGSGIPENLRLSNKKASFGVDIILKYYTVHLALC